MLGLFRSSLELSRRLAAAGHEVMLASSRDGAEAAAGLGVPFRRIPESRFAEFAKADGKKSRLARALNIPQRRAQAAEALAPDAPLDLIRAFDPDLVLIDLELHQHIFPILAAGRKVALLNTWLSITPDPAVPPLHRAMTPEAGPTEIRRAWSRHRLYHRRRALTETWRDVGADWRRALWQIARDNGLPPGHVVTDSTWLYPFAYESLPLLHVHGSELDFPGAEGHGTWIGPMVPAAPHNALKPGLTQVFDTAPGPVIYGGFGSFFTAKGGFLGRLWEVFAARPNWTLILSQGGTGAALPGRRPENIHIFESLPQPEVIARCDAALVHGGINTIDECILGETPMLVCSGSIVDMPGNAARVAWRGLGHLADPDEDSAERLAQHLETLLQDTSVRRSLASMNAAFGRYETGRVAEQVIADLLAP